MKIQNEQKQEYSVSAVEFARAKNFRLNYLYGLLSVGRIKAIKRDGKWWIATEELDRNGGRGRYVQKGAKHVGDE